MVAIILKDFGLPCIASILARANSTFGQHTVPISDTFNVSVKSEYHPTSQGYLTFRPRDILKRPVFGYTQIYWTRYYKQKHCIFSVRKCPRIMENTSAIESIWENIWDQLRVQAVHISVSLDLATVNQAWNIMIQLEIVSPFQENTVKTSV